MPTHDQLSRYRALEHHCETILAAAKRDDWDQVEELGRDTQRLIGALRDAAGTPLDPSLRSEKFRLLRNIVLIDAQIRHLSQPWTRTVDRMLSAGGAAGGRTPGA
jgi:hypothetical protein